MQKPPILPWPASHCYPVGYSLSDKDTDSTTSHCSTSCSLVALSLMITLPMDECLCSISHGLNEQSDVMHSFTYGTILLFMHLMALSWSLSTESIGHSSHVIPLPCPDICNIPTKTGAKRSGPRLQHQLCNAHVSCEPRSLSSEIKVPHQLPSRISPYRQRHD